MKQVFVLILLFCNCLLFSNGHKNCRLSRKEVREIKHRLCHNSLLSKHKLKRIVIEKSDIQNQCVSMFYAVIDIKMKFSDEQKFVVPIIKRESNYYMNDYFYNGREIDKEYSKQDSTTILTPTVIKDCPEISWNDILEEYEIGIQWKHWGKYPIRETPIIRR